MNISVIGGDLRIIRLAQMYANEENKVYTYGLEKYFEDDIDNQYKENVILCGKITEAIENSKYIISGMPFSKDKKYINMPFSNEEISLDEFSNIIFNNKYKEDKNFFAGGIPQKYYDDKEENNVNNINLIDLLEIEELTILNAIPTVEGTIKITIDEREETIHESSVLICGFGRIGKILCDRFSKLGATVYCVARRDSDLAWIREKRYIPLKYSEIKYYADEIDIVINTVPFMVLDKEKLGLFTQDTLIIDLASSPGGIDVNFAKEMGIKTITALGIPGKEMPKTAAKYIKKIIDDKIINSKVNEKVD